MKGIKNMDAIQVASLTGVGAQVLATVLQTYVTFKKSNVEKYFEQLIQEGKDLKVFGERDDLQRYLFTIVDKVSIEANIEKIEKWKNATIHLALDFKDFEFKDNFLSTLESLTVFDLTVLHKIYSTDFKKEHFESELIEFFNKKSVMEEIIMQSLKHLSSQYLITEKVDGTGFLGDAENDEPNLQTIYYVKNQMGPEFLRFIDNNIIEKT
ncbi:MAG: hypothetical protein ACM3YE_03395 [Bacteroidota bacterium]